MYLKRLEIQNIRSISHLELEFNMCPGWHVILGDNGSGKSTLIKAISLSLIGRQEVNGIKPSWENWLTWGKGEGKISSTFSGKDQTRKLIDMELYQIKDRVDIGRIIALSNTPGQSAGLVNDWEEEKNFSAGFGPFRRFTGGSYEKNDIYKNKNFSRLAAHLSLFGEDVALTEATNWLIKLDHKTLEKSIDENFLINLKKFINSDDFLPNNTKLTEITSEGVFFEDGNGISVSIGQLSDGYRSILSLTFELLRIMEESCGFERVFQNIVSGEMKIDVPFIVLIDEVDAHLHPEWQTKIGIWFTKYFPNVQFIITTHSPLICRAAENGSIWRLSKPGSKEEFREIVGIEKEKLVNGNILDAYGTDIFGRSTVRSSKSNEKLQRLGKLDMLAALGKISEAEAEERNNLSQILSTDASSPF